MRQYSKALVLINTQYGVLDGSPSSAGIAIPLPGNKLYKDLWGNAVSGPVTLPPVGAKILLTQDLD